MKALITGITGQDGAYLAKFLLDKGYFEQPIGSGRLRMKGINLPSAKSLKEGVIKRVCDE